MKLAVVGAGKLGRTLIDGLLQAGRLEASDISASVRQQASQERLQEQLDIACVTDNVKAVAQADVVLLCVKPQVLGGVLDELADAISLDQLVISVVASAPIAYIEERLSDDVPVIRAMPNTPTRVGEGMTVLSAGQHVDEEQLDSAREIFQSVGEVLELDERYMDAVTALSASGTAFIYVVLEALAEGGVKVGLPRDVATHLVSQTCLGAAKMVRDTGAHPALLKDEVTTPAGCTIDGLLELEQGGLRVTLIRAVVEATRRAGELL